MASVVRYRRGCAETVPIGWFGAASTTGRVGLVPGTEHELDGGMTDQSETTLLLVRHGESEVTVRRVLGGEATCTGLSELGRRQAAALRDRWESGTEPEVDVLYSSTLPRAIETAEIINPALGNLPLALDEDLVEHRPGDADGMPFDQVEEVFGPLDFHSRPHSPMAPNAESAQAFFHRTSRGLERVLSDNVGRTVLISCHGGVIDIAFRYLLDLPRRGSFDLWTLNTSITEFRANDAGPHRGRWRLVRYNDHAHLAGLA